MGQKLIDNIETNDMNFKHLETTKDIIISPKNEYGDPQRPDTTHTWTAKVSDGQNYVGDYKVKTNATSLIVDSEDFTKLPVGQYQLEVWEQWTDPDGTSELSIYPSPRQTIPFTIYANVADQAEEEIKRIGFQDVVDQAVMNIGMNYVFKVNTIEPGQAATVVQSAADGKNYVTFNIPQGKTGDRGFRGPAGKAFHIEKTFPSVKEMNDSQGKDFEDGDFALISNNVNDPDNAKLYVWDGKQFNFATDMSGAQGIQGPAGPAATIHVTKTYTVPAGQPPVFKAIPKGDGNFDIEVGLPQGETGAKGDKGDPGDNGFYHYTVDLTDPKYDRNKWYYVESNSYPLGSLGGPSYFSLDAPLGSVSVPYGTHGSGTSKNVCARQTILYGLGYWSTYDHKLIVLDDQPSRFTTDGKRLLTFAIPSDNNLSYAFYVRGGLKINIASDVSGLTWTPHTETYVVNRTTIPVLNDAPDPKALGLDDDHAFWALPMSQLKQQFSDDSQLVHNTGNETIAGDKTLVGNTTLATTTILAGNYGLRVTTSGIQKTTDGKTWVPANI